MERFKKAHISENNPNYKKLTEHKKKQLKQMLYGYKISDNKLIHNSAVDDEDSTSVSGFSDLNLTNSSYEEGAIARSSIEFNISDKTYEDNSSDSISFCNENAHLSDEPSSQLNSSNIIRDRYDHENKSFSDDSISEYSDNIDSSEINGSLPKDLSIEAGFNIDSDSEASIVMSGLNLTDSDVSESFDVDGHLAAKIKERLEICRKKPTQKRKYIEVDDIYPVHPLDKEICESKQMKVKIKPLPVMEGDSSTNSDIFNNDIDSIMSPPYVSITASDMPTQSLGDIVGEYKHSTIKNLSILDNQNTINSMYNSGFFVEEKVYVDTKMEEEVGSLIPEIDDIPKLEEIDDEMNILDTATDSLDKTVNTLDTSECEVLSDKEENFVYDKVAETFKVYYGAKCCIITLKHPCELFIQGKVKIRSLSGTLEICGYTLKNESCNIYAPYYNFSQYVKTVENQNIYYGLFNKLTTAGLTVSESEDIVTSIGEYDGVILLQELKNKVMDFLDNSFKATTLFLKSNRTVEPYFSKASDILNCSLFSSRPYKRFHEHPSWSEATKFAEKKSSRGIVCGGKGAGKSTYLRYQVNKLLAGGPVLVVDLDPGQSEFTVAGSVSATVVRSPLFGPSFTHLRRPEIMLNIGMINTMDNAKLYATAVRTLITHCQRNVRYSEMPWVVNTMGMTNALGLKFMTLIIALIQPTYLLQYESKKAKHCFETLLTSPNVKDLYEEYADDTLFANTSCPDDLEYSFVVAHDTGGRSKNAYNLVPKEERYLNFLTYFSHLIVTHPGKNLLGITPYEVSIKDLSIATNVIVSEDCITKVINGKLVALCQHTRQCDSARVFTLSDKPLLCRGHGLIRGIDWEKEILYVITPVPSSELSSVDTLLYADWTPELVGFESQLPLGTSVPYRTNTKDKHQLMSTPRRRFNPLQLLKMSRNT